MFGNVYQPPAWREHVCGLYYTVPSAFKLEKLYLPQVQLQAHSTILATTSRTTLTQTFVNPSTAKGIKEVKYAFPLYDGVSVVGFTCLVGDRTIVGEVKEKEKARTEFHEAVVRGETAGIFEEVESDVFTTTVGNIPPRARVIIKITYLGELKHDMEVDGIRFTIPNIICPRYGSYPPGLLSNTAQNAVGSGISIIVDAEMAEGSFIQRILSPSHPISVSMGTTSSAPNAEPTMTRASATLSLGTTQLNTDFILQIVARDTGIPKAILETHPTIPNQRALMATLVPKFALPPEKPEIVFVCDRSGSMSGSNIMLVRQALQVFLKSLPVGVMFNICSFGSMYSFLWPKSVAYSQQTLDWAVRHVEMFHANYGGTEMLAPLKATIEQRYKDIPLEVMLLTDGGIWDQQALFSYLNEQVSGTGAPIRVYSLGVGAGVSHSLIEGIARAGNGFSQSVGEGEKMDSKVVRMLKGALSPHVNDYTLELKYSDKTTGAAGDEDDYEIIEKVADSLTVKLDLKEKEERAQTKTPISLFDPTVNCDREEPPAYDETGEARYAHLPKICVPKIVQTPQNIPPLFPFNRTTVYLLLGPDSPKQTPTSVILRGMSAHGVLELEMPIQLLDTAGEMIHQLAAKKAISELEQGRGWLPQAKGETGEFIKKQYESRFSSMVEREVVRLGVQFQVSSKWCSFVAVEKNQNASKEQGKEAWEWLDGEDSSNVTAPYKRARLSPVSPASASPVALNPEPTGLSVPAPVVPFSQHGTSYSAGGLFGGGGLFGNQSHAGAAPTTGDDGFRNCGAFGQNSQNQPGNTLFRSGGPFGQNTQNQPGNTHASRHNHAMSRRGMEQLLVARQEQQGSKGPPTPAPTIGQCSSLFGSASAGFGSISAPALQPQASLFGGQATTLSDLPRPLPPQPMKFMRRKSFGLNGAPAFGAPPASDLAVPQLGNASTTTSSPPPQPYQSSNLFGSTSGGLGSSFGSGFGGATTWSAAGEPSTKMASVPQLQAFGSDSGGFGSARSFGSANTFNPLPTGSPFGAVLSPASKLAPRNEEEVLNFLISLQKFEGFWEWQSKLFTAIRISEAAAEAETWSRVDKTVWATVFVVTFFQERLEVLKGSWELIVEKARGWLEREVEGGPAKVEELLNKAKTLV